MAGQARKGFRINLFVRCQLGNVVQRRAFGVTEERAGAVLMERIELGFVHRRLHEAHERYRDKVTDQAGAFPLEGSAGQGNAIAERMSVETEEDSRLFKAIGQRIEDIVRRNQPLSWAFAAPTEINPAIVQHVPKDLREILDENVKHDLTKVPEHSLLEHFGC